jgi:hypothetical protein
MEKDVRKKTYTKGEKRLLKLLHKNNKKLNK